MISPSKNTLFHTLNAEQLSQLIQSAKLIHLEAHSLLIKEGTKEKCFYYLIEGNMQVMKHSGKKDHVLTHLKEGEMIGEMAMIDNAPRSATVISLTPCTLYQFDIDQLNHDPKLAPILRMIYCEISEKITNRLRYTNEVTVEALKNKHLMSLFFLQIIVILSIYTISLNFFEKIKQYLPETTLLSVSLIIIFSIIAISTVRLSDKSYDFFGMTTKNALKNMAEGVWYSIPIMLIILLLKWIAISNIPSISQYPLFDLTAIFKKGVLYPSPLKVLENFFEMDYKYDDEISAAQ